jgi:hypothetical protein
MDWRDAPFGRLQRRLGTCTCNCTLKNVCAFHTVGQTLSPHITSNAPHRLRHPFAVVENALGGLRRIIGFRVDIIMALELHSLSAR